MLLKHSVFKKQMQPNFNLYRLKTVMKKRLFFIYYILIIFLIVSCRKEEKPAPVADFSYLIKNDCVPTKVEFKNKSVNGSIYRWDFGDGTAIDFRESPTHIFEKAGIDSVELTVYGNGGMSILKIPVLIKDLVSEFHSNIQTACVGQQINFYDYSTNVPTSWNWNFGDGTTSTQQNPVHSYNSSGTFNVSLTVSNQSCNNTKLKSTYISIGGLPFVNFSANNTSVIAGSSVNFNDLSQNATNWNWLFPGGNPSSSTQQNPSGIIYSTPGSYSVTLTINNQCSSSSITNTGYILVNAAGIAPIADFSANHTLVQAGQTVNFIDQSANYPTSWNWTFTGGSPAASTLQNPSVTYLVPGTYNVTLTASNSYGSNTMSKTGYIRATRAVITKITVSQMPFPVPPQPQFVNVFYVITDTLQPPGVLVNGEPQILFNVIPSSLPVSWVLSPQFTVPDINLPFKIELIDKRMMTQYNPIGFVGFKLANFTNGGTTLPSSIMKNQNNISVTLDLTWQ